MKTKSCLDCSKPVKGRNLRCPKCKVDHKKSSWRNANALRREARGIKPCENCGDPLPPRCLRWCKKPDCRKAAYEERLRQTAASRDYKKPKPVYNQEYPIIENHSNRRCTYPPWSEKKCNKPCHKHYFFCDDHFEDIRQMGGISEMTVDMPGSRHPSKY